jgi:putative transposase
VRLFLQEREKKMADISNAAISIVPQFMPSAAKGLRFLAGDSLLICQAGKAERLALEVVKRTRRGYVLSDRRGQEERIWSDDEIFDLYLAGDLEHLECNYLKLDEALAELVDADFNSWDPALKFEANCRRAYCDRIDVLIAKKGISRTAAFAAARSTVFHAYRKEWTDELIALQAEGALKREKPRLKGVPMMKERKKTDLKRPSVDTLRNWYRRWLASGRDIRALIPQFHRRGWHGPHLDHLEHLTEDPSKPKCVYGAMRYIAETVYLQLNGGGKAYAYDKFKDLCAENGLAEVTRKVFYAFIRSNYTGYEEDCARMGDRYAWLKYHIFERREIPDEPLSVVEVDHTLIDMFVRDARGKYHRPWLTTLIDRATRALLGFHISFDYPSHAVVQRAIAHAISVKDIGGLGLTNDWPMHGIPVTLVTDRGKEFLSGSLRNACRDLKIKLVNLPGRCPHLKAAVERFFGTLNTKVFHGLAGNTKMRDRVTYNPQKRAKYSLEELTAKIVKWVVDDYHVTKHPATKETPLARWMRLVDLHGVRPVGNFHYFFALIGEIVQRKISNIGIQYSDHLYASAELETWRMERGGTTEDFEVRSDPYERGYVMVVNRKKRRVLRVPAVHGEFAQGYNKFACRTHRMIARQLTPAGKPVTDETMRKAIHICQEEVIDSDRRKAARYGCDGRLPTRLADPNCFLESILVPELRQNDDADQVIMGSGLAHQTAPIEVGPSGLHAQLLDLLNAENDDEPAIRAVEG